MVEMVLPMSNYGEENVNDYLKVVLSKEMTQIFPEWIKSGKIADFRSRILENPCLEKTFGLKFLPRKDLQCIWMSVIYGMI